MVRLEEVPDEEFLAQQQRATTSKFDSESDWEEEFSDAESDVSDDSDVSERGLSLREETIWERLAALKDIVPPSTRRTIAQTFTATSSYAILGGKVAGNLVWVVTTSALLVGLPFALAVEDESRIVAQEKEFQQQQQALGGGQVAQPQGLRLPGF